MTDIVNAIDAWTNTQYSNVARKLFGYCELVRKTSNGAEQLFPVPVGESKVQVSLDDRFSLITWVRLPGTIGLQDTVEGNDWSFGLNDAPVQRAGFRMIVAHKVQLGEDFIISFVKNIPNTFTLADYELVSVNKADISIDADHEAIYKAELSDTVYEKHRFPWYLYAITLNIEYIPCEA
jgi:hypothetical protein